MAFVPQSLTWPDRRALVLIHGVGSYTKANYTRLLGELEAAIGSRAWDQIAVYTTLYDVFNDWMAEKLQCASLVEELVDRLKFHFSSDALGQFAAEGAGDVVWPILSLDARHALRDAIVAQLQRVVLDGDRAGVRRAQQKITIVCHSLGCFHTYEVLAAMASDPRDRLQPVEDAVQFDNVLMFASPVQLIRSVSGWLGRLVPETDDLACLSGRGLTLPGELNLIGRFTPSTRRFVSITGDLDPVGGYLMRDRLGWAYMDVPGQESHIDAQALTGPVTATTLAAALREAMEDKRGLPFSPDNPHDWVAYVQRNGALVKECVLS
jgi:hypothetical protein